MPYDMDRDAIVTLVARNLEAVMARKGTNAAEVARRSGLNPTGVYDILSGKSRSPRLDTLNRIATQGLGIPVVSLLTDQADDALDQELLDTIGLLSPDDRRRILAMIRAMASLPASRA